MDLLTELWKFAPNKDSNQCGPCRNIELVLRAFQEYTQTPVDQLRIHGYGYYSGMKASRSMEPRQPIVSLQLIGLGTGIDAEKMLGSLQLKC